MMKNFRIVICSDLDYEGMVVDINYFNSNIALISNENNLMEIELFPHGDSATIKFPLDGFFEAVEKCRCELASNLLEINKEININYISDFEVNTIIKSDNFDKLKTIKYKNNRIANIYNLNNSLNIELFMHNPSKSIKFLLEEFIEALKIGRNELT